MTNPNELPTPEQLEHMSLAELREAMRLAVTAIAGQLSDILWDIERIHASQIVSELHLETEYNNLSVKTELFSTLVYITLEISHAAYLESRRIIERLAKESN